MALKNNISRRSSMKILFSLSAISLFPTSLLSKVVTDSCNVCKKAWDGLGKFAKMRFQFRYIEPVADLPKIFVYGDSISIGYTEYVRASLKDKACVYRLHKNGQSSNEFIANMETLKNVMFQPQLKGGWIFDWDVIHFNVGLHDLKYLADKKLNKVNGTQVSTLQLYEDNLIAIINYLKTNYPKAKLIFATTTPVPDGEAGRFKGDSIKYNEVALKVLETHNDIIVNDLFTFSIPVWEAHGMGPGNVHYKAEGYRLQGIEVAEIIANTLQIKPIECPSTETITAQFEAYEKNK